MNTTKNAVLEVTGIFTGEKITSGRYGNTIFTANHYRIGDPCYWMPEKDYDEFRRAAIAQEPDAYNGINRSWVEIAFRGQRAFFIAQSDGVGLWGCCIDSGWIAAIPAVACDTEKTPRA